MGLSSPTSDLDLSQSTIKADPIYSLRKDMAFMAQQPKHIKLHSIQIQNEAAPPFQHMNECALTWLTGWHGEMLLHQKGKDRLG
jgi:hypothetical protein